MSCSICDSSHNLTLVDLPQKGGRIIKAWFCRRHLAMLKPKQVSEEKVIARCCGHLVDEKSGRCSTCGDQYKD